MTINTKDLNKKVTEFFNTHEFEEIIKLLTDEVLEEVKVKDRDAAVELYIWRGNAWYDKKDFDSAISNYNKAIEINQNCVLAYYNRGFARGINNKDYNQAIEDWDKVIKIDPNFASAYASIASIFRFKKDYSKAIEYFDKAIEIDPAYASTYFNRGLAKNESNFDLKGSKQDFEKYLELTANENDIWAKYARDYIEDINERINDKKLQSILDLIAEIKDVLRINEDDVTHYTSLSVLKSLIREGNKFRISEGNFMNDPSEGKAFFTFLGYVPYDSSTDGFRFENFSPKPFIGSFVSRDKCDDLNMWRFYGKEDGMEAKGCAT